MVSIGNIRHGSAYGIECLYARRFPSDIKERSPLWIFTMRAAPEMQVLVTPVASIGQTQVCVAPFYFSLSRASS